MIKYKSFWNKFSDKPMIINKIERIFWKRLPFWKRKYIPWKDSLKWKLTIWRKGLLLYIKRIYEYLKIDINKWKNHSKWIKTNWRNIWRKEKELPRMTKLKLKEWGMNWVKELMKRINEYSIWGKVSKIEDNLMLLNLKTYINLSIKLRVKKKIYKHRIIKI